MRRRKEDGNTTTYNSVDMDLFFEIKVPKNVELEIETIQPTVQDEYLFGLLRPKRLLDIVFNFILFDINNSFCKY